MDMVKSLSSTGPGSVKIGLVALFVLAVLFGLANTNAGSRIFAQIGVKDSMAKTLAAADSAVHRTSDALQSFIGRSPGERGATDILKGKAWRDQARAAKAPSGPKATQRALGKIFDKPLDSMADAAIPQIFMDAPPVMAADPLLAFTSPLALNPVIFSPVVGGGIIGGGIGGGGGGGSGGGNIGGIVPPVVPPVASAVPEPSTWIFLLIGFGAIGALTRRAKAENLRSERAGNCVTAL